MENLPAGLEPLKPYLVRATELETRHPAMAYYCLYYAVQLGMDVHSANPKDASIKAYITGLLETLEEGKEKIGDHPALQSNEAGAAYVRKFGTDILENAEMEVEQEKIGKDTARAYMAAYNFLEVLNAFGPLDKEAETMIKYCKYQVTQVMKVMKGEIPFSELLSRDLKKSPASSSTERMHSNEDNIMKNAPTEKPAAVQFNRPTQQAPMATASHHVSTTVQTHITQGLTHPKALSEIQKSMKLAKHAVSALMYEDTTTAISLMEEALEVLYTLKRSEK